MWRRCRVTPDDHARGTRADIIFKVDEGPQTIVEHIFITGNLRTKSRGHRATNCRSRKGSRSG